MKFASASDEATILHFTASPGAEEVSEITALSGLLLRLAV